MPKNFLVTGGCGFIGSHLVEHLMNHGHSITVIDDLSSGCRSNLPDTRPIDALIEKRVEDINLFDLAEFDGVFHLAAQASVPFSVNNFYASSTTNLLSTLKVIDYCARNHLPLIYASSSAVYGNLPVGDECGSLDLLTPYAADKFMAEIYCDIANKLYGLRSYGLRFFNVYGPRQDPTNPYSGVISIFADRILKGEAVTINGGHQTRDFIYVSDVVRGLWNSYEYLLEHAISTSSNLLTGNSVSINDLADMLMSLTGIKVEILYKNLPLGDPEQSLGKINRMHDQLKMDRFVQLDDGIRQVLIWMRTTS